MKTLGIKQFDQKSYKLLAVKDPKFQGLLGDITKGFVIVASGFSGNGKTEFCIQLAKELTKHGKVLWLSYEQRHGYDLQKATRRNKMVENSGSFLVSDPLAEIKEGVSLLEDLDKVLSKRGSPEFVFFDSIDYTGFTMSDYKYLKNKYGDKKGFIFIGHASKSNKPRKKITEDIIFDGGVNYFVSNYIAFPEKNRFGGFDPYVVWEEKAREINPLFFEKRLKEEKPKTKPKKKGESKQLTIEDEEVQIPPPPQEGAVNAKKTT